MAGEELCERLAITTNEARCDISARGFWPAGQVALLDVRVFNPNANRYVNQSLKNSYEINEKEKKRAYNERVQEIEHVWFIPIVMSATGGMAKEPYCVIASWIRREIYFSLIRSIGMCIRGSRSMTSPNDLLTSTTNNTVASKVIYYIVSVWIYEHFLLFFLLEVSDWEKNSCKFMASPPKRKASYGMNKKRFYWFL